MVALAGELGIDHPTQNLCNTGWQLLLRVSLLPVNKLFDHHLSLSTDMLKCVLFCLGHCLAGHQNDCFALVNGTTSAVASTLCKG